MAGMTLIERFRAVMNFQETDRPWLMPTIGFWDETLERWRKEGLPFYVNEVTAFAYFDFDVFIPLFIGHHEQPGFFPPFAPKVIENGERHRLVRDYSGKIYKEFTDGTSSIPQFLEAPIKNMDDFRRHRWRLEPGFPGRCENPVNDAIQAAAKLRSIPLGVIVCGLFGFHRHMLGVETLMTAYFDMPELIHAMSRQWVKLTRGAIRLLKKRYDIIFVNFWEDMCFRSGPLISPNTFRKFMSPYYKLVIEDARENGLEFFGVDTDGDCTLVIPLFEDAGVNLMWPFEVQSGMDVRVVREKHPEMVISGGLDKRALAVDHAAIDEEVLSKVPRMLSKGGYMPAIDHAVPPDVSLENFNYYLRLLRSKRILDG